MAVATSVLVGMADIQVLKGTGQFTCLGLGSCIGLSALDPVANVGGMVHVMLPEAFNDREVDKPGKFADTGVIELVRQMEKLGASRGRLITAMVGGAQVFKFGAQSGGKLDIGARNTKAVQEQLKALGLRCVASEVGGHLGRTVTMAVDTGLVVVKTVSQGERPLCNLRAA